MRKVFQKIVRFTKTLLPFFYSPPTLPIFIDKKDSEFEKFKQDLIDALLLLAIFTSPFLFLGLLMVALALCLAR